MTDLAIVGAGPAGLSAAIEARRHGLEVLLLDENAAPGGRIWQAIEKRAAKDKDDEAAQATVAAFRACGARAVFGAAVWCIEPDGSVFWSAGGKAEVARAAQVLVATGATERPLPVPGWTLPGVMTAGAAQILLKTSGLTPQGRVWLAGQGPLLLLYAVQALAAGGRLAGVLDLGAPDARRRAVSHLGGALRAPDYLWRGLMWRRRLAKGGVPWIRARDLRAEGEDRLARIRFTDVHGERAEPADMLLLHDGVTPSVQITRALGCAHGWNAAQRSWAPQTDDWGRTSVPDVWVAGDGGGIGGAQAAAIGGRITALGIAGALGRITGDVRDAAAAPLRREQAKHLAIRPFLDALFVPLVPAPADDAIVCRCEEITAGRVREAVSLGCLGANQLKAFTRAGMGPCQGRMCGATVCEVIADARGVPVETVEPYRLRFPTKPLTLGELASLHDG